MSQGAASYGSRGPQGFQGFQGSAGLVGSYLDGLNLSAAGSSATFGISTGVASNSTLTVVMSLLSAYTKTTSAWALGTAAGSLDTGTIANSTWYHVFIIQRSDTLVVDILTSLSPTAPTLPSNYTAFRRIGSMKTDGSAQWLAFTQNGDEFLWMSAVADASASAVGTSASSITLSVPTGVKVYAIFAGRFYGGSGQRYGLVSSPDVTDVAAATNNSNISHNATGSSATAYWLRIRTNTSAQIRVRADTASSSIDVSTQGWVDARGQTTSSAGGSGSLFSENGWVAVSEAWTYASATSFTIAGDRSAVYSKGDKIKLTQSAAVAYFYIIAVSYVNPTTTITVCAGSDYSLSNTAISASFYSKDATPNGFPQWFNWTTTFGGFSVNPTNIFNRFILNGTLVTLLFRQVTGGTSNSTSFTMTAPIAAANPSGIGFFMGHSWGTDNGALKASLCPVTIGGGATMTIYGAPNNGAWTASGSKRVDPGTISYEMA
jgi:hypothetical protein